MVIGASKMHCALFIFVTVLMSFTTSIEDGILSLDFFAVTQNEYLVVPIGIGTPSQNFNLVLDIGAQRSWISNEIFQSASSTSFKTESEKHQTYRDEYYSYIGIPATDILVLNTISFDSFNFLHIDRYEGNPPFEGVLSMGYEYDSKKYSIVYGLSAKATTFYNTFSLRFRDMNKGVIEIGDITSEMKDYDHLIDSCALDNSAPSIKWKCRLTHVFLGDKKGKAYQDSYSKKKVFNINEKESKVRGIDALAYFETVYNRIYAPIDFINYLKDNLFKDKDNKPLCTFNKENSITKAQCSLQEINSIENCRLNFVFDSRLNLFLNKEQLFDCLEVCTFVVMNDELIDHWVMGLPIIRNYQTVFDYVKPKISFYGAEYKQLVNMPSKVNAKGLIMGILTLLMVVILIGSAGIGFIYLLRRKNMRRMEVEEQLYTKE